MKKYKSILFLNVCLLLVVTVLTSCSGDSILGEEVLPEVPEIPIEPSEPDVPIISPDSMYVRLSFGGEITIEETPLTRASSNDLYALNVKQTSEEIIRNDEGYTDVLTTNYCYGYFDDLSTVMIKLAKNNYYHYELALIPNGKNLIHQYEDGTYGYPCRSRFGRNGEINEIIYSTENGYHNNWLEGGIAQPKGVIMVSGPINFKHNTIERYQGIYENHYASETTEEVKIPLYRMMFGLRLVIEDFTEGEITLRPSSGDSFGFQYTIKPSTSGTTAIWEEVMEMPNTPIIIDRFNIGLATDMDEQKLDMYIIYTLPSGEVIPIHTKGFNIKRLSMHTLTFSLSNMISNGGVEAEIADDSNEPLNEEELEW